MNIKSKNSGDKVKRHKNEYLLMNKDIVIGKVHIENNEMDILGIKDIKSIVNIKSWLHDRVGIMQRQNIIDLAKMAQISNLEEFINITNMVSVTDAVWMKRADTNITWRQVSPYQNTISAVMANIALDGLGDSNKCGVINFKSPSPQYRLEGTADKCVKRVGNSLRIYKSCGERWSDGSGLRPYCEYFAYKLMKKMSLSSYARYSLKEKRTENGYIKPYVVSDVFTNEECGLLSMGHSRLARVGTKKLIKSLSSRDAKIIKEMCLLDSLIVNGDRHDSNYGFIINNNNLKIDRVAPIYDNDMGLGATIINLDSKSFNDAYNELMSRTNTKLDFEDFNTQVIRTIDRGIYGKLLDLKRNPIKFENDTVDLSDRRVDFMSYIVNRRVDDILELINSLV